MEVEKNSYPKLTVLILFLLILLLGVAYAWLAISLEGEKTNSVIVGTLSLKISDESSGIYLTNAYPVTDEIGLGYQPYTFSITNDGNIESNYAIYLDDEELSDDLVRMNEGYVKYSLIKNGVIESPKLLTTSKTDQGRLLDTGTLGVNQTNNYELRLWIDKDADNNVMRTTFYGKIRVEAEQIKE